MRKIIYTRPDGGLSIAHPVINTYLKRENITETEAEQRAWDRLPKDAINPQWVAASAVPTDRTFRNAWKASGAGIAMDMPKARDLHRTKLRELRKPLLEALDTAYLRADELGDLAEKARITAKKQALRDVTNDPAIDAAATPEALAAVMPAILRVP